MATWAKWTLCVIMLPIALLVAAAWGIYALGAAELGSDVRPSGYQAPALIRNQYLRVEVGDIATLPRLNPITVWWAIFRSSDAQTSSPAQTRLLGQASRLLNSRRKKPSSQWRHHAAGIAGMVIVSRHWSRDQVLDTLLDQSWFGRDAKGIESAAVAYYGVPAAELRPEESLALVTLMRGPSYYDPSCRPERFAHRYWLAAAKTKLDSEPQSLEKATNRLRSIPCQ